MTIAAIMIHSAVSLILDMFSMDLTAKQSSNANTHNPTMLHKSNLLQKGKH